MGHHRHRCGLLAAALFLAGCASAGVQPVPLPPTAAVPTLLGTWTGTWGGSPLTLVVAEQRDLGAASGLYLGPVQLLGQRAPGVAGVMTSTIGGQAVSVGVQGWLGTSGGALTLVLSARTLDGMQYLTLRQVEAERLGGNGESDFPWGPQGAVDLVRPPAAQGRSN